MKIAIASDDGKHISAQFEKTAGFIMVVVEKDRTVTRKDFIANSPVAASRDTPVFTRNNSLESRDTPLHSLDGCDVVISRGIGFSTYTDLLNSEIEVYLTRESQADQAVSLYLNEQLDHHPELRVN